MALRRTDLDPPKVDVENHRPGLSTVKAIYGSDGTRTSLKRVYEAGSLRLRHPRGQGCEAVLLNTSGGVVASDQLDIGFELEPLANVIVTSAAAEKIYRSDGAFASITTRLSVGEGGSLSWIPQETILFDRARLRRTLEIDLAEHASLIAAELVVFGRVSAGEQNISGSLHDSWRVKRTGRLVFADETRIEGAIGATLARTGVAAGAHASALVIVAKPDAAARLDLVRSAIETACADAPIEGGASLKDGIIIARLIAHSSELLRRATAFVLGVAGGIGVPRVWQ